MRPVHTIPRFSIGACTYVLNVKFNHNAQRTNPKKVFEGHYWGCLVVSGTGTYTDWEGRVQAVEAGCFVHHHPGKHHHIERPVGGWDEYALMLNEPLYERFRDLGFIDDSVGVVRPGLPRGLVGTVRSLMRHVQSWDESRNVKLLFQTGNFLHRIRELSESVESPAEDEALIQQTRARLARDLRCEIDLEKLAASINMSYSHFRRLFKRVANESPAAFRNRHRMEQARLILEHNRVRMAEVAERLGFSDQFAFSRAFKKQFGVAPKKYNGQHAPAL
jgi:AraC-like DNA-binding protein